MTSKKDKRSEFLRQRAELYVKLSEWRKALACLNRIVVEGYDEKTDEPLYDKRALIMRSKVRLILCENDGALEDALIALRLLRPDEHLYHRALALRADALFQMGDFEHALVFYHRAKRVKDHDDYKRGVQQATEAIKSILRNRTRIKKKIEFIVENEEQRSRKTFVVGPEKSKNKSTFRCEMSRDPFRRDVKQLKNLLFRIQDERWSSDKLETVTKETLEYLQKRRRVFLN